MDFHDCEVIMKIKNPKKIEFICPDCKTTEKIPLEVVRYLDSIDQANVDTNVPPRFDCQRCNGKMIPKFYIGVNGQKYIYNVNNND